MTIDFMILALIVLFASFLQTSTGYGFSIIGTPFLLIFYPPHTAIQINIVLSIFLSAFMIFKIRHEVDKNLLISLVKGSFIGLFFGIFIYLFLDIQVLKMAVGLLIIILTFLLFFDLSINQTKNRDFTVGGLSGLLTTSIGVPGPPLLLYFSGAKIDKITLRSTTLAYFLFVYLASLALQITFSGTSKEVWLSSIIVLPALYGGILLGQLFFKWISQLTFRIFTYLILIFTGIYLVVTSW